MAMSNEGPGSRPKPAPKGVSPVRNAIALVLLAAVVTVGVLEVTANRGAATAVAKLEKALPGDDDLGQSNQVVEMPTMDEVQALIHKTPDGPPQSSRLEQRVSYTWRGVFKKYIVFAYYTNQAPPRLLRIRTEAEK